MQLRCGWCNNVLNKGALLLLILGVTGCTVGPDYQKPQSEVTAEKMRDNYRLTTIEDQTETEVPKQMIARWWMLFDDPILTSLEQQAFLDNLDLRQTAHNISQSRARLAMAGADYLPTVSASGSYAREGNSENGKMVALGAPSQAENYWTLGLNAHWELDLWGRQSRILEMSQAQLMANRYLRESLKVSLAAEIAKTYFLVRHSQAKLQVNQQEMVLSQRISDLVSSKQSNGVATTREKLAAQSQVVSLKAQKVALQQELYNQMNALALLLGKQPQALNAVLAKPVKTLSIPQYVPTSIPSDLAESRPDVLKAAADLHRAVAAIGVAKADFYPSFSLVGHLGTQSFDRQDLLDWDSRDFSVGPSLYLPIFQGGKLKQKLALTEDNQRKAALKYKKTLLMAWHEVDNAIDGWYAQRSQFESAEKLYQLSQQSLQATKSAFQQGTQSHLSVLEQTLALLSAKNRLLDKRSQSHLAIVSLYRSLGGGWDEQLNNGQVSAKESGDHE